MAVTGFYTENEQRDYPFLLRVGPFEDGPLSRLPHSTIVDFGAVMGINSGYLEDVHQVYLHRIDRRGNALTFEFRTTSPDAEHEALVFFRDVDAAEYAVQWSESVPLEEVSASSISYVSVSSDAPCPSLGRWEGFLVTGPLDDLLELLPDDGALEFAADEWVVEPARMQSLLNGFVNSINLANFDRVHSTPSTECGGESEASEAPPAIYVHSRCLQGDLKFKPGYNCSIRQEDASNTIVINASKGAGEGEPCEEVPLYEGETSPDGGCFLGGGPACDETIRSINGKSARDLRIQAGQGLRLAADEELANTLRLQVVLDDFNLCITDDS